MVDVRFRCGHRQAVNPDKAIVCRTCGETRVARTLRAEPPRFSGHCTGPHAETRTLGAMAVNLVEPGAALSLTPAPREQES